MKSILVNELSVGKGPTYEPIYVDFVTVMESGDPGLIMVAKSLLENADIRYPLNVPIPGERTMINCNKN